MSDIKKSAIIFKQRAKELGYEIKLTHCQEILAKMNGHKTRHSFLLENSAESSDSNVKDLIKNLIQSSNKFTPADLEIIESIEFKAILEKNFYNFISKELNNFISKELNNFMGEGYNIVGPPEAFIWKFNTFFEDVKKILRKKDNNYTFETYLETLNQGKFRDIFFLGLEKKQGMTKANLANYFNTPNGIFVGCMGSGKSISCFNTTLTWMLANSDQSITYIVDTLKGANDFKNLFKYNQVIPIFDNEKFINLLDDLYNELSARKILLQNTNCANILDYEQKTGQKITRLLIVLESFHVIPYHLLNFHNDYKTTNTPANKFYQLMRMGRSLGIWFNACAQRGTASDIPQEIVPNFTQKQIFKVSKAESVYFLANFKAAEIPFDQKGRCETDHGTVQFPYIESDSEIILLEKYMKPLSSNCLFINQNKPK